MPDRIEEQYTESEASDVILMFAEIAEFLFVVDTLPKSPHLLKHPRFKEIFSGGLLPVAESKTTPRDTLFELTVAALFERAGLHSDILAVADVETVFLSTPICTECKRLQSFGALETRIGEAHHQLVPRIAARGKAAIGLIALSVTKALTEGTKKLITQDEAQMHEAMHNLVQSSQDNLALYWERYVGFDGVLLNICVAGQMTGPFVNTQYALLARPGLSDERAVLLGRFLETLRTVCL